MSYLTTDLLEDVRFQCRLSDTDPDFTDARLLKMATQELQSVVFPFLINLREDWFVQEYLVNCTIGQNFYEIHPRSYASGLRELKLYNTVNGSSINLQRYDLEDPQAQANASSGIPSGFFVEDNYIILDTLPASNGYALLQYIWLKPGKLVLPSQCATLVSSTVTGTWTISSPSPSVTAALGSGIDIVAKYSPHNTKCFQNVTLVDPTTITGVYGNPKVGDYVCPSETNPTIGIPEEFSQLLVLAVAARVFETLSPSDLPNVVGKLDRMKDQLKAAISPRIEGAQKQIISRLW